MFYEAMNRLENRQEEKWPAAREYISGKKIPEGCKVNIPILGDNILLIGVTGYGKTTAAQQIVDAALSSEKDIFAVFLETKREFRKYITSSDKVISFSMTEKKEVYDYFQWNMIAECRRANDPYSVLDSVAELLFAELLLDGKNKFFAQGSMDIFKGYIKTILQCYKNCPCNRAVINGMKTMSYMQIIEHLLLCGSNRNIVRDYFGYDINHPEQYKMPKRAGDLMAFLSSVLNKFGGTFCSGTGIDTIRDYLDGKYGKRLFLIYDYSKRASSNLFFRFFLQRMIEEQLAQDPDRSRKLLLVLDEAPVLEGDFGLMEAVTLGRGCNLQVILTTQSLEKLYGSAPEINREHITKACLAGFPYIIAFHPGDGGTIELLMKLFGTVRKQMLTMPMSRYGQPQSQYVSEPKISEEDLSSLDIGECYVKIRSADPVRVKLYHSCDDGKQQNFGFGSYGSGGKRIWHHILH